jgi:hypothetical protein
MVISEVREYHMSEVPLYNVSVSNDGHAHGRKLGPTLRVDTVFHFRFSISGFQFSVFGVRFSVFGFRFLVFGFRSSGWPTLVRKSRGVFDVA